MPGRARGRTTRLIVNCSSPRRLNGCPAERAGGQGGQWKAEHDGSRLNGCPAERAGGQPCAEWAQRETLRLNGCPAERAGGPFGTDCADNRSASQWMPGRARGRTPEQILRLLAAYWSQWMPGRARGRTVKVSTTHGYKFVSMDARPSARADRPPFASATTAVRRLNGCPAERAGGQ